MKRLLLLLLFAIPAYSQVQPYPFVKSQFFDNNGHPLAGGCLFTYNSGTTTPLATFTDFTGTFLNTNPVILDSAGRADIWLSATAYRFRLKSFGGVACASGTQLWTEDGINPSANSILGLNNVWTGTNTWNAAATFNSTVTMGAGFTSNGPSNLTIGGSLNGTFSGNPTFSGTPNFTNGFNATTATFSGQITSTVATGTSPFLVSSTTRVVNLNADLLDGCDWAVPCPLGSTTPNTVNATALVAGNSFQVHGGAVILDTQGTDTKLLTSGTVAGTGAQLCTDANLGATTVGCPSGFTKVQSIIITAGICSTAGGEGKCTMGPFTWNSAFADATYSITCTPTNVTGTGGNPGVYSLYWINKTAANFQLVMQSGSASAAGTNTTTEIDCIGIHP